MTDHSHVSDNVSDAEQYPDIITHWAVIIGPQSKLLKLSLFKQTALNKLSYSGPCTCGMVVKRERCGLLLLTLA